MCKTNIHLVGFCLLLYTKGIPQDIFCLAFSPYHAWISIVMHMDEGINSRGLLFKWKYIHWKSNISVNSTTKMLLLIYPKPRSMQQELFTLMFINLQFCWDSSALYCGCVSWLGQLCSTCHHSSGTTEEPRICLWQRRSTRGQAKTCQHIWSLCCHHVH